MQSLADDLAGDLGDRVRLNKPVATIGTGRGGPPGSGEQRSRSPGGLIAVPPMMTAKIIFHPPLPEA